MVTEAPRPGEDPDESPRLPPERNTEPIPTYPGPDYDQIVEFDDHEFAALGANQAGVGFDQVDLIATREPSDLVRRYLFPTESSAANGAGTGSIWPSGSASACW